MKENIESSNLHGLFDMLHSSDKTAAELKNLCPDSTYKTTVHDCQESLDQIKYEQLKFDVDQKIEEMECMFMEMAKNPTLAVLDHARTKCMGS